MPVLPFSVSARRRRVFRARRFDGAVWTPPLGPRKVALQWVTCDGQGRMTADGQVPGWIYGTRANSARSHARGSRSTRDDTSNIIVARSGRV